MKKLKDKKGMTLAEVLVVIAIIAILGGVVAITVVNHRRSLGLLERNNIAKEIFVAAQNHLTVAYGEGYLGLDSETSFGTQEAEGIYYFVVNGAGDISKDTVLGQMLPFGSIDETVRAGGSYIIRYQKDTGTVLDVFYCSKNDPTSQYNHFFGDGFAKEDLEKVMNIRYEVSARRNWVNGSILGWYGGDAKTELATLKLKRPNIKVVNAEKLYVEVTDPNNGTEGAMLSLIISGVSSGAKKAIVLRNEKNESVSGLRVTSFNGKYTVVLDDITEKNLHFADIQAETSKFIPGEDIQIQAVSFSRTKLANIAYSAQKTTNSLFGSIRKSKNKDDEYFAYIGNIRHLENLDSTISNLDANDSDKKIKIKNAEQTDSFSWNRFRKEIRNIDTKSRTGTASDYNWEKVCVYDYSGNKTGEGCYMPIEPDYELTYDGKSRSISDVVVNVKDTDAGLFGSISKETSIKNLELIDFNITGTASAGALAGTLNDCTVTNVLARNSTGAYTANITGETAGGLIGTLAASAKLQCCAAAVIVKGSAAADVDTFAGGLVGDAQGTISGCYSGGHTKKGSYEEWVSLDKHTCDVTGATAGGLVGKSSSAISDSYSTCSVSGTTAGGFAGSASAAITNCYAAGLVQTEAVTTEGDRTKNSARGSFAGSLTGTATNCQYYSLVNEVKRSETKNGKTTSKPDHYLGAAGDKETTSGVTAFDSAAGTYDAFVGDDDTWDPARAYDAALVRYYNGKYPLKTVYRLYNVTSLDTMPEDYLSDDYKNWNQLFVKTHYGDWPSPETFVVNS